MKRGKMVKGHYVLAMLVLVILSVSACKGGSGAATGTAPRTPFIGGTAGITMNFEKDNPPPEVTDDESYKFNAIVDLKNDGEFDVNKNDIKVNLVGFDPGDFGSGDFGSLRDQVPTDDLTSRKRDAEGTIIEGPTITATFPKGGDSFNPRKFPGNTEFTFRAEACYYYETHATSKLCILKDMINIRDGAVCIPTAAKTTYSSSGPVQISGLRETVVGKDRVSFSFDVSLVGNAGIYNPDTKPSGGSFDGACPKDPTVRRQRESRVLIEIKEIPSDPIVTSFKCGGLGDSFTGTVMLVNNRRTITCTVELVPDRNDLEKNIEIDAKYNVLDNKETKVLVKHLATSP